MVKEKTVHGIDSVKRKDASVVKKGTGPAVPQEHWVKDVSASVFPRAYDNDPMSAFLPMSGTQRAQPHKKINETDH